MPARWITMRFVVLLGLVIAVAPAAADTALAIRDDGHRVTLPGGIELELDHSVLKVKRGKQVAELEHDAGGRGKSRLQHVRVAADHTIVIGYVDFCMSDVELTVRVSPAEIDARLAAAAARELRDAKQYAAAAKGFAAALALDPAFEPARLDLATALAADGKPDQAVAALAPLIARQPARMYVWVTTVAGMAAVAATPAIRALKAKVAGTATVRELRKKRAAVSQDAKLVAAVIAESCGPAGDGSMEQLAIVDASGGPVTQLPLVQCGEAKQAIRAHEQLADRQLADLGFVVDKDTEPGKVVENQKARIPGAKLGVVIGAGVVRLVRGDTVLAEHRSIAEVVSWAAFVPGLHAVVVGWTRDIPEAECGNNPPYSGVDVIALP